MNNANVVAQARVKSSPKNQFQLQPKELVKVPQMKKVGNFLIEMERYLGHGQYGKVYLAQELTRQIDVNPENPDENQHQDLQCINADHENLYACKVVERKDLCSTKEGLIVSEIQNQDAVISNFVVRMKKAIKTDARYYIFMEFCNGHDLKEIMEMKLWKLDPCIVQKIMQQLVQGFSDMMDVLVIHRDLKLQNIMLHFPDHTKEILKMSKE